MTTAGFVSGARDEAAPSGCSRVAAAASLLLGAVLLFVLPALADAAFYVAVLDAAAAVVAISAGLALWSRVTLVARTIAGLAAGATVLGQLVQASLGLPGTQNLDGLGVAEGWLTAGCAALVLVFLTVDGVRRQPEPTPDQPYAL